MAERTGYNLTQTKTLMENIKAAYDSLGKSIQENWATVQSVLKSNWVGEDEQDYEDKLAKRICEMYVNTYAMGNNSLNTIYNLAESWYKFQQSNKLDGTSSVGNSTFNLELVQLTQVDQIVQAKIEEIGDSVDRGLVTSSSKASIKDSLETFKTTLQSKAKEMMDAIEVNSAFFGSQSNQIKKYVEKVGESMGLVSTAIKDMYQALDTLTGTSYNTADSDISSEMKTGTSNLNSSLGDLGNSRWG